jgi:Spy/CpxP family protein refolding chaperone
MKSVMIALLFLALGLCGEAAAGPRVMGPEHMGKAYIESELGLTPEQSRKLQELRLAYLTEITPLQSRLFAIKAELRLLWASRSPDREQITIKQSEIAELQKQLDAIKTRHRLECREVLTPEQREKAAQLEATQPMGMGWKHGRMHRGWSYPQ